MILLEIKSLKKSYRSPLGEQTPVIHIPYFALQSEEQIALEGSSGSGKTTLLHLISGILTAEEGSILLDGHPLTQMSEAKRDEVRANTLGYVFQNFNLLQGFSALENVMMGMLFGKGIDSDFAHYLLTRVGLQDRLHYRPHQLSVGQQQRVAVARALANKPRLVLADEPTGNLDFAQAQRTLQLIRELCREHQTALLLVSHDREILQQFERVEKMTQINPILSSKAFEETV